MNGALTLHRWAQAISAAHPGNVYQGEQQKIDDLAHWLPSYLVASILEPASRQGRRALVVSEEWQTARFACALAERVAEAGLGHAVRLAWNANNTYGFDQIDWPTLARTNRITAVSRWMRQILRGYGVDSLVVPNGIPSRLLRPLDRRAQQRPSPFGTRRVFFKMGRWEPEKGWGQALDALVELKRRGRDVTLVARCGSPSSTAVGIAEEAASRNLVVADVSTEERLFAAGFDQKARSSPDVVALGFPVSEDLARVFYTSAEGVLANSVYEPFGLVGLEAMAVGGLVYVGGTGEDYAVDRYNAVVLETLDPIEIADRADELANCPELGHRLREAAHRTARRFHWPQIARGLVRSLVTTPGTQGGRRQVSDRLTRASLDGRPGAAVPQGTLTHASVHLARSIVGLPHSTSIRRPHL